MKYIVVFLFSCFVQVVMGQNVVQFQVSDSLNNQGLFRAKIQLNGKNIGVFTDENGKANFHNIPQGFQQLSISSSGYFTKEIQVQIPADYNRLFTVLLRPETTEMEEVRVEATRSNRSISNSPTRTEVLTEEIDEAASMEPSKIAHLLTHSTGIQVQTTSATSNGAVVRVQGLNGRYTQMLKDGFPLYGGFSGSLDILQIPPLDLRQVEYIKGSASTLYGGGAIGGLVNLLTKRADKDETLLHLNLSHIGAKDFNAFISRRKGKFGFTNLASMHLHSPYDADKDGFSDVPDIAKFNFNPKFFYSPNKKTDLYLGAFVMVDNRAGGDMKLLSDQSQDSLHFYTDKQKSQRFTSQFSVKRALTKKQSLEFKNSISHFDRAIEINQNMLGNIAKFSGVQLNSFSELNYSVSEEKHNVNIGLNYYTSIFRETPLDTFLLRNQENRTAGMFVNHLWDISKKFSSEMGFRGDYASSSSLKSVSNGEFFALPRWSMLYKWSRNISTRIMGGMGYRMPSVFSDEAEPFGYQQVSAVDFENVQAERSYGSNFDIKYQSNFGTDKFLLTLNQMFYFNQINNPILLQQENTQWVYSNANGPLQSMGFESQIKLTAFWFTWFLGYTYTDATLENNTTTSALILTPKHSIKGDLLFVVENAWRIGWDYEYKSAQLLSSGLYSPSLFTTGVVVERTLDNVVLFLNAENFTDVRQTRFESIVSAPYNTPQFTDIYAPLDGFFFNAGIKIKL